MPIFFPGGKESQHMQCVCVHGAVREVYISILKSRIIYIKLLTMVTLEDWDYSRRQKDTYFISDVYILFEFSTENTLLLFKKKKVYFWLHFPT